MIHLLAYQLHTPIYDRDFETILHYEFFTTYYETSYSYSKIQDSIPNLIHYWESQDCVFHNISVQSFDSYDQMIQTIDYQPSWV